MTLKRSRLHWAKWMSITFVWLMACVSLSSLSDDVVAQFALGWVGVAIWYASYHWVLRDKIRAFSPFAGRGTDRADRQPTEAEPQGGEHDDRDRTT